MKKILIAMTAITCSTSFAYADVYKEDGGFYIGGQIGASIINARSLDRTFYPDDDYYFAGAKLDLDSVHKTGVAGGFNLGYNFQPAYDVPVRTELSFTIRSKLNKNSDNKTIDLRDYFPEVFPDPDPDYDEYFTYTVHQKNKVSMNTLMLNAYYDIYTDTSFTPFIGAGVGLAFSKLEGRGYDSDGDYEDGKLSKSKTKFAWNVATGVAYKLSDELDLDFTVRYINAGKITAKNDYTKTSAKLSAIDLLLGARYNF